MRISTRTRYGLRLMLDLAVHYGQGYCLLKDIARRQELSEKYLNQILIPLRSSGLVRSERGAKGGYTLVGSPDKTTVLDVVQALDGRMELTDCLERPGSCKRQHGCATRLVWKKLGQGMREIMQAITLEELVRMQKTAEESPLNFEI